MDLRERGISSPRGLEFYPPPEVLQHNFETHPAKEEILTYLERAGASPEVLFHWPETKGGLLSDAGILRHLIAGNIVIDPFDHRLLQPNSHDVRLGRYFYLFEDPETHRTAREDQSVFPYFGRTPFYNPYDHLNVAAAWTGPMIAEPASELFYMFEYQAKNVSPEERESFEQMRFLENINPEDLLIILTPFVRIMLGHTIEFIGGRNVVTARISGISGHGRNLTEICNDANLGAVGFCSRWTLEITNKSIDSAHPLIVGERIATISFEEVGLPLTQYQGSYQQRGDVEQIKADWRPEMMLPRLKRLSQDE